MPVDIAAIDAELDAALGEFQVSARRADLRQYQEEVRRIAKEELEIFRLGVREALRAELHTFQKTLRAHAERTMRDAAQSAAKSAKAYIDRQLMAPVVEE
jgi:hypothetical protein